MSLAQGNKTPTRPRIEPGSPDPESDALTTRPVRPPLTGLFRLHYDRPTPVLQKPNRFEAIIRIVCDNSMFILEIVYKDFS